MEKLRYKVEDGSLEGCFKLKLFFSISKIYLCTTNTLIIVLLFQAPAISLLFPGAVEGIPGGCGEAAEEVLCLRPADGLSYSHLLGDVSGRLAELGVLM